MVISFSSCSIRKAVPKGEKLVNKVRIKDAPKETKEGLYNLIEEKPNRRIFGVYRFHLRMYLLSQKFKWLKSKKKKSNIWEPPKLYTAEATERSVDKMELYLKNQGYYNAKVSSVVKSQSKKKLKVKYLIQPGEAYKIADINFYIEDRLIDSLVRANEKDQIISPGVILKTDDLSAERERIMMLMRSNGYYGFSREYIYFDIDSSLGTHQVSINLGIQNPGMFSRHLQYKIADIYVQPNYSFADREKKDTILLTDGFYIIGSTQPQIDDLIYTYTFLKKGDLYDVNAIQNSLKKLRDIQQFKYIDIDFRPKSTETDSLALQLELKMTPYDRYELQTQAEVNTSEEKDNRPATPGRLYGMAGSYTFRDLNFTGRGIRMETQVRLAAELDNLNIPLSLYNYEFSFSNNLYFPKPFLRKLIPQKYEVNIKNSNLGFKWLWERNSDFNRSTGSANLGYVYQKGNFQHIITPLEFSYVQATLKSAEFKELIDTSDNLYLRNLFTSHTISASRWALYYSNKPVGSNNYRRYWELQFNAFEGAGNLYSLVAELFGSDAIGNDAATYKKKLFGMNFFQYYKGDYDIRYHQKTFSNNEMVYRAYLGLIIPYGNTENAVPFEKRYYAGGSNSIRGWNVRQLGPGTYSPPEPGELVYLQSGDIKMEFNFEYRFDLSSLLEMAVFADAGNIWNHPKNNFKVEGGEFSFDTFYKQFALAGGVATRFDFNYFIFRLDFAIPMRDPSVVGSSNDKWFPDKFYKTGKTGDILHVNFGIGYPF